MSQAYVYHEEDVYGIGKREELVAIKPKATPESSPEPAEKPVSPSSSNSGKKAKARRKAQGNRGDAYLLRTAFPNNPEESDRAKQFLPRGDSSDDLEEEDVADMDERLAQVIANNKKLAEENKRQEKWKQAAETSTAAVASVEVQMADVVDRDERFAREMEDDDMGEEKIAEDLRQIAADAIKKIDVSNPSQQLTPSDQMDHNHRQSNGVLYKPPPQQQQSGGLGIWIKPEVATPSPLPPRTPMEPNFSPYEPWPPLSHHRNSVGSPGGKIPAMLQSPASPESATSPLTQLPSAREILEVADKMNEAQRQRHASMSSMAAPSPLSNGGYRASFSNAHPSPSMINERTSPKSSLALSPPSGLLRRESYPLLPSATPKDSQTNADVTSPANTLPTPQSDTHRPSIDENTRTLPLIPGVPRPSISVATIPATGSGGYKCDFPGCTAPPFQTSYLLNSHANVHSTNRPHYCPVQGCPRGVGGKGFKRKNEMIRHGLVHDSPGYVCPFCPDREHKYPRPDNLQRHVRVHHTEKSKEDPLLREVLAQRPEFNGGNRGRRRRVLT